MGKIKSDNYDYFIYKKGSEQFFKRTNNWKTYCVGYFLEWKSKEPEVCKMRFRTQEQLTNDNFEKVKRDIEDFTTRWYHRHRIEDFKKITVLYIVDFVNYTADLVCTKSDYKNIFKEGLIYKIKDGNLYHDNEIVANNIKNINDLNNIMVAQFAEIKAVIY